MQKFINDIEFSILHLIFIVSILFKASTTNALLSSSIDKYVFIIDPKQSPVNLGRDYYILGMFLVLLYIHFKIENISIYELVKLSRSGYYKQILVKKIIIGLLGFIFIRVFILCLLLLVNNAVAFNSFFVFHTIIGVYSIFLFYFFFSNILIFLSTTRTASYLPVLFVFLFSFAMCYTRNFLANSLYTLLVQIDINNTINYFVIIMFTSMNYILYEINKQKFEMTEFI